MYAVSLLPSEYKNYQNTIKRNDKIVFYGLIAVITVIVVMITSIAISGVYTGELKNNKDENTSILKKVNELKPIEELQNRVAESYSQINQTAGLSPAWDKLFADIGNSISPEISFISVDAKYQDQGGLLIITGNANNHEEVSTLIKALSSIDGIGDIKCKFSSETAPTEASVVQFELDILITSAFPYDIMIGGAQ